MAALPFYHTTLRVRETYIPFLCHEPPALGPPVSVTADAGALHKHNAAFLLIHSTYTGGQRSQTILVIIFKTKLAVQRSGFAHASPEAAAQLHRVGCTCTEYQPIRATSSFQKALLQPGTANGTNHTHTHMNAHAHERTHT